MGESFQLNRVAESGAGAVRFHEPDGFGGNTGSLIDIPLQTLLRNRAGSGDAVRCAVVIDAGPANDAVNVIAVADGIVERLESQHADAFGEHEAVGLLIEGAALAGGREHRAAASHDVHRRRGHNVHAAGERHCAFP